MSTENVDPLASVDPKDTTQPAEHEKPRAHFPTTSSSSSSQTRAEAQHVGSREPKEKKETVANHGDDNKREITEAECYDELGYSFPTWKKWTILSIIFLVQTSMNFNTSLYSNGLTGMEEKFNVSAQAVRAGAAIFLITYAFGCELWAPWSEEFGRWIILQLSLGLVNIWNLPVVLAPNFGSLLVGRALGGLSSAGGSVTLGMIADIFEPDNQQYAVAYIVFSSVGGSILGPIIGGFCEQYLAWQWCIWIQLIFGVFVQALHFFLVPETRSTIMMDKIAKKRRKSGVDPNVYGPNELFPARERLNTKEIITTWIRPFRMFLTEPIVLTLSLLSGFSDALIFMQIQSFSLVYGKNGWGFTPSQIGLAFIPIGLGYVIAWLSFFPAIKRNIRQREAKPDDEHAQYESRLWWLLYTAPCLPIGLIIFAWTSSGPPLHWVGSMFGSAIIGIANYAIYMATIDYMICAYGPYSASATGGNGWSRDFLAGILTVPATPFYTNIGGARHLEYASTILFCIASCLVVAVYVIYWKGPVLRKRSPFAQQLHQARRESVGGAVTGERRGSNVTPSILSGSRRSSMYGTSYARDGTSSRRGSAAPGSTRPGPNSRQNSHAVQVANRLEAERERELKEKA